jgi:Kef-type K+ transport system membrane component KefB
MKKLKDLFFYILMTGGLSALMYWIVVKARVLEAGRNIVEVNNGLTAWEDFKLSLGHNFEHPLAILLFQIVTIILTARIFGWFCKKIGQPSVIGEIIAGIALGPSLLGAVFPEFSEMLFPKESLGNLQFLSQIGLILFMFVIGMELDTKVLKNKAHEAIVISHASIVLPFSLGMGLAYFLYLSFAPVGIGFASFGLFLGIAMSITAFPVLARIIQERGMHKTRLGSIIITCAAADDLTAWCLLAAVIAIVKAGSFAGAIYTLLASIAYVLFMIKVVRPFLKRIGELYGERETLSKPVVAIFFLTLLFSAYTSEIIGIHALFGAFMAGAIMPDSVRFRSIFIEKVEDVSLVLLLPLFFVFTGLRTEIGLLNDISLIKITLLIIAVAVAGKFLGSAIAAKFVGRSWRDSLTIGALMNTRGLMELVVLNIGYDLGVLTPEIFAMMVIMALVTTFMTGPTLNLIDYIFRKDKPESEDEEAIKEKFKILVAYGNPETGRPLLRLSTLWSKKSGDHAATSVIHLSHTDDLFPTEAVAYEKECFEPVIEEASKLHLPVTTLFKISNDIEGEITEVANKGAYQLLIAGISESIYEGSFLGKILGFTTGIINPDRLLNKFKGREKLFVNSPFDSSTTAILTKSQVPVAIFVDKGFTKAQRIIIPIFNPQDAVLAEDMERILNDNSIKLSLIDTRGNFVSGSEQWKQLIQKFPNQVSVTIQPEISSTMLQDKDLMFTSVDSWKTLIDSNTYWLKDAPSTVIIKK